uniref:C-type lectin domain-containing protein n=1 Tax=Panagrellus redivivus TaxID=6233 RepID=A0A7E4VNF9_PANRE
MLAVHILADTYTDPDVFHGYARETTDRHRQFKMDKALWHFHNDTFDVKNFEWTDGTPVDFIGWNRFSNPETNDYRYAPLFPSDINENVKFSQVHNKIHDGKSGWSNQYGNGFQNVLCKMKATVTTNS